MSNEVQGEVNIDDLLDSSIDDLADMPAFAVYPSGVHRVQILGFEKKLVNKHPSFEMKMKLLEVVELAESTAVPPEVGTETNTLFMMDNDIGQGSFKDVMKCLARVCGTSKVSETMEAGVGMELNIVVKTKPDKKDPDIMRMNIKKVSAV